MCSRSAGPDVLFSPPLEPVNLALRLLALLSNAEVVELELFKARPRPGNPAGLATSLADSGATKMSRPIWKGHISFGLVNVPVVLNAAERRGGENSFRMVDSRNSGPGLPQRVNQT